MARSPRMSARGFARELIGYSTSDVYEFWRDMGLVVKGKFGTWVLTALGVENGGKMSSSNHPTPTFNIEELFPKMVAFYEQHRG